MTHRNGVLARGQEKEQFAGFSRGGRVGYARVPQTICPSAGRHQSTVLVTGGAGFIGSNLAHRLLILGQRVVILDNLSRHGAHRNVLWLQKEHGKNVQVIVGDVRDRRDLRRALRGVEHVFHLAAQVAVTTSLSDPRTDFEINTLGTVNLLDEIRAMAKPASLVYTSTNKVYGALADIAVRAERDRYVPFDPEIADRGISERRSLDFQTPYGCSKGSAEQYVIDHARTLGLCALVFRMSCIYGSRQFGTEDQGWVAHFLIRALGGQSITVYGDGKQVRDILFIDDLVDALVLAWRNIADLSGHAYNIGGGVRRTVSLLELADLIAEIVGRRPVLRFEPGRAGDQRYYVSNIAKFRDATGWEPKVAPGAGILRLYEWLNDAMQFQEEEIIAS